MPLMPYMSPALMGMTTVRPRGRPSARKRAPSAARKASGVFNPDELLTASTAPSGTSAAARSRATIFELIRTTS